MKNMKVLIIMLVVCIAFSACHKDLGNYNYHPVNEISFKGIDTVRGYKVNLGQTLKIAPELEGTLNGNGSANKYTYEWSLDFFLEDSVISVEKDLDLKVLLTPGVYTLQYKVIDQETGIRFQTRMPLLVTTNIFEGYLVMSEVDGHTRLDMVSYSRSDEQFTLIPDVLGATGSTLPLQGKPLQVFCMENEAFNVTPFTYRIYLVTETGTYKINPETFGYTPLDDFRYEMAGNIPSTFRPNSITGSLQYGFMPTMFVSEGNNVYKRNSEGVVFTGAPINVYAGQSKPFKAFPQVTSNDDAFVIYNTEKRLFTTGFFADMYVTDLTADYGFPEGKDLIYTEDQTNGLGYAVMKDPDGSQYYMFRFYPGFSFADYFEPMNATDIDKASHFAVSPELGYLFYSVGGKLYEYDLFVGSSTLMLDKGNAEITHLSFEKFFNTSGFATYNELANLLTVASIDPSGPEGSNGTMELYSVPPLNASLSKKYTWTGFGRINSVAFRERN